MTERQRLRLRQTLLPLLALLFTLLALQPRLGAQPQPPSRPGEYDKGLFKALAWRSIGPFRGGRVTAASG